MFHKSYSRKFICKCPTLVSDIMYILLGGVHLPVVNDTIQLLSLQKLYFISTQYFNKMVHPILNIGISHSTMSNKREKVYFRIYLIVLLSLKKSLIQIVSQ